MTPTALASMPLAAGPGEVIISGGLLLALPLALLAGFISFASPCVLPVVPGYLALIGATTETSTSARTPRTAPGGSAAAAPAPADAGAVSPTTSRRGRIVLGASLFVLGFSVVYVISGAFFGQLGLWLLQYQGVLTRILGAVVIVMGLVFLGAGGPLQRTLRLDRRPAGLIGAPLLGAVFALGWAPCIGPTLIAIQSLSLSEASAGRGALLAFAYCLGLGAPFVLAALGWQAATGWFGALRRHVRTINLIGGAFLILIGLLMVLGIWQQLVSSLGAVLPGYVSPL